MKAASPGPAPAAQARASNWRVTPSSWRTCPQRKLRRNVPRVDGALTVQPSTGAVPPERKASLSSMQSPPASAEATRVSNLSPCVRPPRRIAEVELVVDQLLQAEPPGQCGREEESRVVHQATVVESCVYAVGVVRW